MAGNDGRSNCWAFILWLDSMPAYTFSFLRSLLLPVFVSPLHDKDVWTYEDSLDNYLKTGLALPVGSPKKPHYHVMIKWSSNKSCDFVLRALAPLHVHYVLQLGKCEKSVGQGWRDYARYLCHLDDPQKFQYDPVNVLSFNAGSYFKASALSNSASRLFELVPIFEFVRDNELLSFSALCDYCAAYHKDWFPLVLQHSNKFISYMKSLMWSVRNDIPLLSGGDTTTPPQVAGIKSLSSESGDSMVQ